MSKEIDVVICGLEISDLPRSPKLILESLQNDEVVTLSKEERNELYHFMEKNGIDPNDYRQSGGDVWLS